MTSEYREDEMDEIEKRKYVSFVGYINPRGQLIDYTTSSIYHIKSFG